MKKRFSKLSILSICIILVFGLSSCGNKQSLNETKDTTNNTAENAEIKYPTKPIKFIVPWSAGGSSDTMSRAMSSLAEKYFEQPLVVVNRDGAGGTIATTEVKGAEPDGYTVMLSAVGVFTSQPKMREVMYSLDDFEPIIGLSYEPIVLAVNADSDIKNFEDVVNYAKNNTIKYGHSGTGSLLHLAQAALFDKAGIKSEGIPFDGAAPSITALLGKQIDIIATHPGILAPHVESGKIKILGIFSPERFETIEDVPTFKEMGYDIDFSVWKFLLVPKGIDESVKNKLTEQFGKLLNDPEFSKFAESIDLTLDLLSPEEVKEKLENEIKATGEIIDKLELAPNK